MQTTKGQILTFLKRNGGGTVEEVASAFSLSPMTVRQHLASLERDNLITYREVRRPIGRPHFLYQLTEKGHEAFPHHYDRLVRYLLEEVVKIRNGQGIADEAAIASLLESLADRMAEEHSHRLLGKSFPERVETALSILREEGGLVEGQPVSDGVEVRDYNCLYRRALGLQGPTCPWHRRFLSHLLGRDVRGIATGKAGPDCCSCLIEEAAADRLAA